MKNAPSPQVIRALLDELGLRGDFRISALPGSYSNFTQRVDVMGVEPRSIVIRRYNPAYDEEGHDKSACEYHALEMLRRSNVPAPTPLLLDRSGEILGLPGIVTEFVEGQAVELPRDARRWGLLAAQTARMLARIHQTPFADTDKPYLMDDNVEVAWFIKDGRIPDYMRADADGDLVWHLVKERWGRWNPVVSRFAHTDYWSGNILWRDGEISAVVDWEEAGYGHPAADVAYARMGYFVEGEEAAADEFLRVYEAAAGWTLSDLALFELAASARPMTSPDAWFAQPYMEAGYRRFIAQAAVGASR